MNILTIAIPTKNGEDTIEVNLKKLTNLKKKYTFQIIVSDNCSTDKTAEIVKKYTEVEYYKNDKDYFFDINCHLCVKRAKGNYVWLLSDNDSFNEEYFEKLYLFLSQNTNLNQVFLDFKSIKGNEIKYQKEDFKICHNGDEYFNNINFKNGFLSANIVNKKIWLEIFMDKYIGENWIHVEYSIRCMEYNQAKAGICKFPIIYDLPLKEQKWGDKGTFIYAGLSFVNIIKSASLKYYSKQTIKMGIRKIEMSYPRTLISAKINGLKTDKKFTNEFFDVFDKTFTRLLFYYPILITPNIILNSTYRIYRLFVSFAKITIRVFRK